MSEEGSKDNPILIDIESDIDYCCICELKEPNHTGPNCLHTPKCCKGCVNNWIKRSLTCPYCRAKLHLDIELQVPHSRVELGIKIPAFCTLPPEVNWAPSLPQKKRAIKLAVKDFLWIEKERAKIEFNRFSVDSDSDSD